MLTRDINPFGLRMPAELKQRLDYKAKENGRSLNSEIVTRLHDTLANDGVNVARQGQVFPYKRDLLPVEQQLLSIFRSLSPEKQLALISLFK